MTADYTRPTFGGSFFKGSAQPRPDVSDSTPSLSKPKPKVVEKIEREIKVAGLDRKAKEEVRQRDGESCRICGRKTREVHERILKSRGGVASLQNSACACRKCHRLIHGKAIKVIGTDCRKPLEFLMEQATAYLIFRGRPVPKHVTVTPQPPGKVA